MRGNCYVTCEALYHLLGGKEAGYTPHTIRHEGSIHWYLVRELKITAELETFFVIDPTAFQFKTIPDYLKGRGRGFLTKKPSKRAQKLIQMMLYQG
jgi:hypothetical protein